MSQAYYESLLLGYDPESFRRRWEQAFSYGLAPPWSGLTRAPTRAVLGGGVIVADVRARIPFRAVIHADKTLSVGPTSSVSASPFKPGPDILVVMPDGSRIAVEAKTLTTTYYADEYADYRSEKKSRRRRNEREQKKLEFMKRETRRLSSVLGPNGSFDNEVLMPSRDASSLQGVREFHPGTGRVSSEYVTISGQRAGMNTYRDFVAGVEKMRQRLSYNLPSSFEVWVTDPPFNRSVPNWVTLKAFDPDFKPWPYCPAGSSFASMEIIHG